MSPSSRDPTARTNPNPVTMTLSDKDRQRFAKEVGVRATGLGWLEARARRAALEAEGCTEDEVLEGMVDGAIARKENSKRHLCSRCWHDASATNRKCICHHLGQLQTALPAKVLVLMHHKEYLKAGDDAKLLLAMLPAERTELYVFGRRGDLARLQAELRVDPAHTLILWPGNDALTVDQFVERLPRTSPWRSSRATRSRTSAGTRPLCRARAASPMVASSSTSISFMTSARSATSWADPAKRAAFCSAS